jgi:ribosomal protein L24
VALCSEPDEEGILITVRGAPKGSKIYYDDSLVPINPFRVKEGDTLVPLRVEAPKGREFKISIVPSKDQVVNVRKLTVTAETEPQRDEAPDSPGPNKAAPVKPKKARESDKEVKAKDDGEPKKTRRRRFDWRPPWRRKKN